MDSLARAHYAGMRWNAPLSPAHAQLLLGQLDVRDGDHVLDLGCGWGELLELAVAAGGPATTGVGVDTDDALLDRARSRRHARMTYINAESSEWADPADRLICIGASHAWVSPAAAFAGLAALAAPGARLVFGEGVWERPPTAAAAAVFGDGVPSLTELVSSAEAAGWRMLHLSTADQREFYVFESSWRAGRQRWLLEHPEDGRAADVRAKLDAQQAQYFNSYRGILGFAYLVLGR